MAAWPTGKQRRQSTARYEHRENRSWVPQGGLRSLRSRWPCWRGSVKTDSPGVAAAGADVAAAGAADVLAAAGARVLAAEHALAAAGAQAEVRVLAAAHAPAGGHVRAAAR